jgi:hypothetical protein
MELNEIKKDLYKSKKYGQTKSLYGKPLYSRVSDGVYLQ